MAETTRPAFKVIQGGGEKPRDWLSPPPTVLGKSPFDRHTVMAYRVAAGDLQKHLANGRRQPILDLWWHVRGELPPVPGAQRHSGLQLSMDSGLHTAHASFRGLMRPAGDDDRGFDWAAFITKPRQGLKYRPSLSSVIEPYTIPSDVVFVIYARLDFPEGRAYRNKRGMKPVTNGVITHWQFVECDPENPQLPIDHQTRFRRRYW